MWCFWQGPPTELTCPRYSGLIMIAFTLKFKLLLVRVTRQDLDFVDCLITGWRIFLVMDHLTHLS